MFWTGPSGGTASIVERKGPWSLFSHSGDWVLLGFALFVSKKISAAQSGPQLKHLQGKGLLHVAVCGPGKVGFYNRVKIYQGHELTGDSNRLCPSFFNNPASRRRPGPEEALTNIPPAISFPPREQQQPWLAKRANTFPKQPNSRASRARHCPHKARSHHQNKKKDIMSCPISRNMRTCLTVPDILSARLFTDAYNIKTTDSSSSFPSPPPFRHWPAISTSPPSTKSPRTSMPPRPRWLLPLQRTCMLPRTHTPTLRCFFPRRPFAHQSTCRIAQGIAPSFWGPMADCLGRRQILIYTLLVRDTQYMSGGQEAWESLTPRA